MKRHLLYLILAFCVLPLQAQHIDWSRMQGLENEKGQIAVELSGYEIYILQEKGQLHKPKDIKKITKKYKFKNILREYTDTIIGKPHLVIESRNKVEDRTNTRANQVCYIFPDQDKKLKTIVFNTINERDSVLERSFVKEYLEGNLSEYILSDLQADTISFVGRNIPLGSACKWRGPHNIYCMGGQISWSEFSTFEAAEADINARIASNASDRLSVLQEEDIDVIFEDIPSLAHRVVYREKPQSRHFLYYNSSMPLVVYYIVQEVRGRYVSCVMSNYGYNKNDYELSTILQQVMSIPNVPENAHNQFDIPVRDEVDTDTETIHDFIPLFEIRSGIWQPLGNLKSVYEFAPSIELYMGLPIKTNMSVDLGIQLAFPVNRKEFDFYYLGDPYYVKTNLVAGINLRWHYEQVLAKNVYFSNYLGAGVGVLQTDLEKDNSDEDGAFHTVETFDLFGGVGVRYKRIGVFVEYHFLPYSIAGKVRKSIGNSAVNTGIYVSF